MMYVRRISKVHCTILAVFMMLWSVTGLADDPGGVYELQVDGLSCPFCAYGIEKRLTQIEGVQSLQTDISGGVVVVTMRPDASLDEDEARQAVEKAGFTLRGFRKKVADG